MRMYIAFGRPTDISMDIELVNDPNGTVIRVEIECWFPLQQSSPQSGMIMAEEEPLYGAPIF